MEKKSASFTVVVAEKPSVAKDLARVLGSMQKGDGFLHGNGYIVTWAIGHLLTLNEPEDYDPALKKWRAQDLPILPSIMGLKPLPKTMKQLGAIKRLINHKTTKEVVCATDSGREGELIFRYIYAWCGCRRPVLRLWISSLTDEAIKSGLGSMKPQAFYDNLYKSAKCRSEADWLVGMSGTRAFTLSSSCGELLPVGRVQTPTLAMIVDRDAEIKDFVPVEYYEVKAEFETLKGETYSGLWVKGGCAKEGEKASRITNLDEAKQIANRTRGRTGTVQSVVTEEKRQLAPLLFDLTELQRECNRKLRFPAQKTLTLAQSLYEKHKLISYPRTDSRYLSEDIMPKIPAAVNSLLGTEYESFARNARITRSHPRVFNNSKVTDHHAIILTGKKVSFSLLTQDERAVFDRIARNFLAAFYPPHIYDITTVITAVGEDTFLSKGRTNKADGWTLIYAHESKAEEPPVPALVEGECVKNLDSKAEKKKTEPPKPHTEATLLSMMENAGRLVEDAELKEALKSSGLGTPATRAQTIEKLISSGLVTRSKKNLLPTEKGIRLVGIVPKELKEAETTAKWERALSRIASGDMCEERFMASIRRFAGYLVEAAQKSGTVV